MLPIFKCVCMVVTAQNCVYHVKELTGSLVYSIISLLSTKSVTLCLIVSSKWSVRVNGAY